MARLKGIDVSHWNDVNSICYKLKNGSAKFCIAKATQGITFVDKSFEGFMSMCENFGAVKGAYHFAEPHRHSAKDEASHFLNVIENHIGSCVMALDWEAEALKYTNWTREWAIEWLDYVYKETGVKAVLYASESSLKAFATSKIFEKDYGLWVAKWSGNPIKNNIKPWKFWAFHQYTNKPFDHDYFNGSMEQLVKYTRPDN